MNLNSFTIMTNIFSNTITASSISETIVDREHNKHLEEITIKVIKAMIEIDTNFKVITSPSGRLCDLVIIRNGDYQKLSQSSSRHVLLVIQYRFTSILTNTKV